MAELSICDLAAIEIAGRVRAREVSAREVVEAHIARVEAVDGVLNALVTRTFEQARAQAAAADDAAARGDALPLLHGLPVAHKDLAETRGVRTTYGSSIFAEHVPTFDALHVARMRAAGAISLGKTNTPEFGAGSQTFNRVFGATRNPYDPTKTPGGSSGGAAAALAVGEVALADGSDMGGSLRNPASFCNVVGLRPSPGRVPAWPSADGWSPLSVNGPMARTVADVALLLTAISGPDHRVPLALDGSVAPEPVHEPADVTRLLERDLRGLRVAWSVDLGGLPIDPAVRAALAPARAVLEGLGAEVVEAQPDLRGADQAFRAWRAFAYALSHQGLLERHRDELKDTVVWNIEAGLSMSMSELLDATRARNQVMTAMAEFFGPRGADTGFDVLACPVSQVPPFDVDLEWVREIDGVPMTTYLDWMASACRISITGLPAMSVPAGFTDGGLPVGLQLVGRPRDDWGLLQIGHAFETATGHGAVRPSLGALVA
ncbi:MAG TPA: amidase [Actinomycetes bacterium]|nr:amidase [Actinomycetes bacterium]